MIPLLQNTITILKECDDKIKSEKVSVNIKGKSKFVLLSTST
jgi:hypothetical protein